MVTLIFLFHEGSEFEIISHWQYLLISIEIEHSVASTLLLPTIVRRLIGLTETNKYALYLFFQTVEIIRQFINQSVKSSKLDLDVSLILQKFEGLRSFDFWNWFLVWRNGWVISGRWNEWDVLKPKIILLLVEAVNWSFLITLEEASTVIPPLCIVALHQVSNSVIYNYYSSQFKT